MPVLDRIRTEFPIRLTALGKAACLEFDSFPELQQSLSNPMDGDSVQRVLEFGWPLAIIGSNQTASWLRRRIGNEIQTTGHAKKDKWAVIHAGALFTALGGQVEFLKERKIKGGRTSDIRAILNYFPIDCEVTFPERKRRSNELGRFVNDMSFKMNDMFGASNYCAAIYIGDVEITEVQKDVVMALGELAREKQIGVPGRWHICIISRDEAKTLDAGAAIEGLPPKWWPDQGQPQFDTSENAPHGQMSFPTFFRIEPYTGAIRRKADRPQGGSDNPFVIVIDATHTAVPHDHINRELLANWFPLWDHVSGVLLFDRRPLCLSRFCWKLSLHLNLHARVSAVDALGAVAEEQEICVTMVEGLEARFE